MTICQFTVCDWEFIQRRALPSGAAFNLAFMSSISNPSNGLPT
jgi:hypothetical protein